MADAISTCQELHVEANSIEKEAVMKTMRMLITMMAGSTSAAYAATAVEGDGMGILTYAFIGFFALIIVSQLVPATILFIGMVKGLFSASQKDSVKAD
jgi:hypothetical protein